MSVHAVIGRKARVVNTVTQGSIQDLQRVPASRDVPVANEAVINRGQLAPGGSEAEQLPRRSVPWKWIVLLVLAVAAGGGIYIERRLAPAPLPAGIVASNGRLEARQIDVAAKLAGRIAEVLVEEGDFVEAGQVIARMDTNVLQAQLREAEADAGRARNAVATAAAVVEQRRSERELAATVLKRSENLVRSNFISVEKLDNDRAQMHVADAALAASVSQVTEAKSAVVAAAATVERIRADLADSVLRAPKAGRIQYRLAEPGEVLAGGGKVVNMLDLANVYMTVFLPETSVGKLALGSQARLVFDAAPQFTIPAKVSFVAAEAQFTPKTVETATERQKLVFRVKAQVDPMLLRTYWTQVKAGMPGIAYVRTDPATAWPAALGVRLPPPAPLSAVSSPSAPARPVSAPPAR